MNHEGGVDCAFEVLLAESIPLVTDAEPSRMSLPPTGISPSLRKCYKPRR